MRRELEPWLTGREILAARLVDAVQGPKYTGLERLARRVIRSVERRGKFLLLPLGDDELVIHLGMTGVITQRQPDKHVRVRLELSGAPDLYFQDVRRFGRFLVVPAKDYATLPTLNTMGPEPLTGAFNERDFAGALGRSTVAIKTYLLSQKPVAGVGNIYADEALWGSKIHPLTPANRVPKRQIPLLVTCIKDVLEASIAAQGTTLNDYRTVNGEVGTYLERLNAYGRSGDPCPRCGTEIERIVIGGRSTHLCPRCQKRKL